GPAARGEYLQELRDSMALSRQAEDAPEIYREIVRQIVEVDFPSEVDRALRSARESLRELSGSEIVDEEMLAEFDSQMDALGEELKNNVGDLRAMREEISAALQEAHENREGLVKEWQDSLNDLLQRVEPIRESAIEKAQELSELRQQEIDQQQAAWDAQLAQFQSDVYSAVCEYGVLLRELPSDEHLSLILKGLGNKDAGPSEDLIIVLAKSDLERCQSAEINAAQLRERAQHYSF
ncbi:MAG: hypothetical protein R3332_13380, partial [Pseudohongiellaceae bacterium]|nr:hypothetical protein [Pseudohongiellaceae bacterium]